MSVQGEDIRRLRERRELTQKQLAETLNATLGRKYTKESIGRWENGRVPVPAQVGAFLEQLIVDPAVSEPPGSFHDGPAEAAGDIPPGGGSPAAATLAPQTAVGGGAWARACEELWELVATGVGMVGAATGSQALLLDGAIIAADKQALGAAWGKLAETNETFRRMLVGLTEGGAWLQVALVTGTTVSRCYQNHAQLALQAPAGANGHGEPEPAAAA